MRHRSIERTAWQAAFLEALDMQKEELISNRRNRSSLDHDGAKAPYRARAITLSEKTKAAKEEIARVEEEDRLHSQMFQSLQMNAVKTAKKKSKQATVDASDSRMKLGETKAKLQLQRLNYIEVRAQKAHKQTNKKKKHAQTNERQTARIDDGSVFAMPLRVFGHEN